MWFLKILIKIFLSRLPLSNSKFVRYFAFRNGGMNKLDYSKRIFFGHLEELRKIHNINRPVIMEIGPGDGIATAIYSKIYDSPKVYLIDACDFADKELKNYKKIIFSLRNIENFRNIDISSLNSFQDILDKFNTVYLTNGLSSFKQIKSESVDYIYSHSVMEHIRLSEVDLIVKEMFRVLKKDGLISHNINYKDHLSESLNNLRFSKRIWESDIFANSGFYTNRIPAIEMHKKFKENGFEIICEKFGKWSKLPITRKKMHKSFNKYSDSELINCTSSFTAKKIA